MGRIHNRKALKPLRRDLRNSLTSAEVVLWKNLQRSQLAGRKFRRQHSIGNYVVDFYCPQYRLAVELDGQKHFNSMAAERDLVRTRFLEGLHMRVLRFENRAVFENLGAVLETIKQHLTITPPPLPNPLLNQEGGFC
ncbi:MAG TPA: endonuclease domain-containing protein [Terriglobia bacterium]|nr:endonuclease domain-containing protein [Terriglobia bacterium]